MARLQSLRPQVASLPSRLKSTFTLGKEQEAYGQGRGGRPWRRTRPVQPLKTPIASAPADIADSSQPTDSVRPSAAAIAGKSAIGKAKAMATMSTM